MRQFFILAAFCIALAGCQKTNPDELILGSWECTNEWENSGGAIKTVASNDYVSSGKSTSRADVSLIGEETVSITLMVNGLWKIVGTTLEEEVTAVSIGPVSIDGKLIPADEATDITSWFADMAGDVTAAEIAFFGNDRFQTTHEGRTAECIRQ